MRFNDSRGMSLAGVLVGVAVLGIVAVGMMGLGQHVMQILEIADTKADVQSEIFILQAALADEATCKANFQGLLPGNTPATLTAHDGVLYMADASGALSNKPILPSQDKNNPSSRLQVASMKIQSYQGSPHVALLTVEFNPKKGSSAGALRPREVPLQIALDGAGKVARCSTSTALSSDDSKSSDEGGGQGRGCEELPSNLAPTLNRYQANSGYMSPEALQAGINLICGLQTYPVKNGLFVPSAEVDKCFAGGWARNTDACQGLAAIASASQRGFVRGDMRFKERTGYESLSECQKQSPFSEGDLIHTQQTTRNGAGTTTNVQTFHCVNHRWGQVNSESSFTEKGSCFIPEARVTMSDGSLREIADLRPGDRVRGRNGVNTVMDIEKVPLAGRSLFSLNGGPAFVTAEHPFFTPEGWKSFDPVATREEHPGFPIAEKLGTDDVVLFQGFWERLQSVEEFRGAATPFVYNLLLDGDHTYTVEGYLVHNKTEGQ